jgi:putative membrane protein
MLQAAIWGGAGTILLLVVYLGFELLTPKLNVSDEIGKGNVAVGLISCFFSIAFSLVIAASIS